MDPRRLAAIMVRMLSVLPRATRGVYHRSLRNWGYDQREGGDGGVTFEAGTRSPTRTSGRMQSDLSQPHAKRQNVRLCQSVTNEKARKVVRSRRDVSGKGEGRKIRLSICGRDETGWDGPKGCSCCASYVIIRGRSSCLPCSGQSFRGMGRCRTCKDSADGVGGCLCRTCFGRPA